MNAHLTFLPKNIYDLLKQFPSSQLHELEEIRIRINRPLEVSIRGVPHFLSYIVQSEDAIHLMNKISHFSIYALEEELKRGYITIEGGHRVGLAGKVILENGKVKAIRDVSSFNFRIAKEQKGIAEKYISFLFEGRWHHTMIIGPPQAGKTTFLRDIARMISTGGAKGVKEAYKVGIIDERSEIAGSVNGIPQLTFGPRVDVLDACPKAEGMMMMIRSMSPDVLVVDEIGSTEDVEAILEAVHAGIKLITTIHGHSLDDIKKRPALRPLIEQGIFKRYIELARRNGPGTIVSIKDQHGHEMFHKASVK
ncbi:stage III sporulation protein AA [Bacillus sp. 03113]|uniref:stage III sporulation protein AA n=1 Tax=Bacillus sp. 03113 TaxID=2578211 RepID=UPI00114442D5|nr:stage III sporulation protein AA [Bacillus sp. 03113]